MQCHAIRCKQAKVLSPKFFRYRGIALVWTAIVITTLLAIVGLSLDIAKLRLNLHQLQNATDAAALSGATIVKIATPDETRQFTYDLGYANKAEKREVTLRMYPQPQPPEQVSADDSSYDILLGRWVRYNRTFIPTLDAPNAVQAVARRTATLASEDSDLRPLNRLLRTFGVLNAPDTQDASTTAVAWCYDSGGSGFICLSDIAEPGLNIGGNVKLDVDGGGIHVNSYRDGHNHSSGAWLHGGGGGYPEIDTGFINVVGVITPSPFDSGWESIFGIVDEYVYGFTVSDKTTIPTPERIEDPVAAAMMDNSLVDYSRLKVPELIDSGIPTRYQTLEGTPITDMIDFTCTLGPGYYPYGISLTTDVDITLLPNSDSGLGTIFVFGGCSGKPKSGLVMNSGSLTGHGVTCYVTQNFSNGEYGEITITGGKLDLVSPGDWTNQQHGYQPDEPIYQSLVQGLNGIAVWQDPTMVDKKGNTPDVHLNGNGEFLISGTLYFPNPIHARLEGDLGQAGNQIICGSADVFGGAEIHVSYDGRNGGSYKRASILVQ
jgi:hypothetical protein